MGKGIACSTSRGWGVSVLVLVLVACGGSNLRSSRRVRDVSDHLRELSVRVDEGGCDRDGSRAWSCVVTAEHGVEIEVRVTRDNDQTYYETVRGLLDGAALEARIGTDYERRLGKAVEVRCKDVIPANDGDRVACMLTPDGEVARKLVVRIVDDRTGDYAVVGAR